MVCEQLKSFFVQTAESKVELDMSIADAAKQTDLVREINGKLEVGKQPDFFRNSLCFKCVISVQAFSDMVITHSQALRQKIARLPALAPRSRSAFLSMQVMPVDAFKIRNSLFLTVIFHFLLSESDSYRTTYCY